jgi:hypothetical protein
MHIPNIYNILNKFWWWSTTPQYNFPQGLLNVEDLQEIFLEFESVVHVNLRPMSRASLLFLAL